MGIKITDMLGGMVWVVQSCSTREVTSFALPDDMANTVCILVPVIGSFEQHGTTGPSPKHDANDTPATAPKP